MIFTYMYLFIGSSYILTAHIYLSKSICIVYIRYLDIGFRRLPSRDLEVHCARYADKHK